MAIHLRRIPDDNDEPTERGTYRRVREYWDEHFKPRGAANPYWAELVCPGCGHGAMVGRHHTVDANGVVSPSSVCPHAPCAFHEFVVLDDWARPATPRRA